MAVAAALLGAAAAVAMIWPRIVAVPLAVIGGWVAVALLARAWALRRPDGPGHAPAPARRREPGTAPTDDAHV